MLSKTTAFKITCFEGNRSKLVNIAPIYGGSPRQFAETQSPQMQNPDSNPYPVLPGSNGGPTMVYPAQPQMVYFSNGVPVQAHPHPISKEAEM